LEGHCIDELDISIQDYTPQS
ncbi:hypothetical protein ACMTAU_15135, partial [Alcaligenes pakistanensis]